MVKTIGYEKKNAKSARSEKEEKSWLNDTKALRLCEIKTQSFIKTFVLGALAANSQKN